LNIVHVCRQYYPSVGGLEAVVEALAKIQLKAGHKVRVVTLNRIFGTPGVQLAGIEDIDGVEIIRIPFFGSDRYPIAPSVLRHIRNADIVHVHAIDFFFDFLALTRRLHRKPMIATTHGGFFHTRFAARLKRLWFATITRMTSRAYDAIAACSLPDRDMFGRIAPRTVRLIENGVEVDKFRGLGAPGLPSMIYFGRLAPNKALDRLLRWFAAVHRRRPEWTLTIAGRPGGVTVDWLRAEIGKLAIEGAVSIVPSPDDEQLSALIARSGVYVCASRHEGFGLAAVEAASAGLLPVLSDVPAFAATVARLGVGLLLDFDAPEREAERFLSEWRDPLPGETRAMIDGAASVYGWEQAAARYQRLYDDVLHGDRRIGNIRVNVIARSQAIARIRSHLARRDPLTVAFCNAHTVNTARVDPAFARAMQSALVLNDGIGIDIASRMLFGRPFPDNLNGTDLVPALLEAEERPLRLFLLGSAPGVAERAACAIRRRFPAHIIVGLHHGRFATSEEEAVVSEIIAARPDLLLVGMGHPRQEIWAARFAGRIGAVVMCIGAYLDFAAGIVPRAPMWMRRARIEWVYRLLQEPRRLAGRYLLGNVAFLCSVAMQRLGGGIRSLPEDEAAAAPR
jgi:alpha-1,3-mannosyltransferase